MIKQAAGLAILLMAACAGAQPSAPQQTPRPPMMVGGYSPVDAESDSVKAARDMAVSEIYARDPQRAIVEAVTAERQVVAGSNYRFDVTMTGGVHYRIVVYQNLQQELKVTSFAKVEAPAPASPE